MATLSQTICVEKQSGVGNDISKTSSHVASTLINLCELWLSRMPSRIFSPRSQVIQINLSEY